MKIDINKDTLKPVLWFVGGVIIAGIVALQFIPKDTEPEKSEPVEVNLRETKVYRNLERNKNKYGNPPDWHVVCEVYSRGGSDRVELIRTIAGTDNEFDAVELFITENC